METKNMVTNKLNGIVKRPIIQMKIAETSS